MDTQEAYAELGLHPGATDAQLKASWRRLVAAWHPDRNAAADAGHRMQSINKAYLLCPCMIRTHLVTLNLKAFLMHFHKHSSC